MISLSAGLGYWTTAQAGTAAAVSFVSCLNSAREDNLSLIHGAIMAEAKQQFNPQLKK
jgi:hypothetical protein